MSGTDRHRPYWVQVADSLERNRYTGGGTTYLVHHTCSCSMCGMGIWRRLENRQARHDEQRRAREALKGDREAFDRG